MSRKKATPTQRLRIAEQHLETAHNEIEKLLKTLKDTHNEVAKRGEAVNRLTISVENRDQWLEEARREREQYRNSLKRLRQFVHREIVRAKAYGNLELAEIFEEAHRDSET